MHNEQRPLGLLRRRCLLLAAVMGWSGLAIQQYLIFISRWDDQASLLGGLVKFFSFFTVLSNTLVAVALTCALSARSSAGHRFFRNPTVCGGITASIALVSIAYNLLLRHLWQPEGWQWLADELLHDIMPAVFIVYWCVCVPKAYLGARHVLAWMLYPLVYFGYVLIRGSLLGDYVYPFIDIGSIGVAQALINASGVLAGFVGIALLLLAADRLLKRP